MKTTEFKNQSFAEITRKCNAIADACAVINDCNLIMSDMVYSLVELRKALDYPSSRLPFYIAVREQGVESGTKDHVIERCKSLGNPIYVMKVEQDENQNGYTFKVRTH